MRAKLYIAVTPDQYELPLAVADSVPELSKMMGMLPFTIYSAIRRSRLRNNQPPGFVPPCGARFYVVDCCNA